MRTPDASFLFNAFFTRRPRKRCLIGKIENGGTVVAVAVTFFGILDELVRDAFRDVDRDGETNANVLPGVGENGSVDSNQFASADDRPPLFPGLIAASVCSAPETNEPGKVSTERFLPEIIPVVNV